jgi:Tfp pilus assembly protein PilV
VRTNGVADRHAPPHGDAGFTIVELCAALTVIAVGVVGVIGVMTSSFGLAGSASARSKAVSVATREVEAFRSRAYADLVAGSYSDRQDTVGGRSYRIQTAVTWADESAASVPVATSATADYKRATVEVSWTDNAGGHSVHQNTMIYPGGLGAQDVGGSVNVTPPPSGNPLAPSALIATVPTDVSGTTGVDLVWTPPANSSPSPVSYVVQYSTDASFATYHELTNTVPASTTVLRVTDLAASTTYHFRVASKAANGNLSSSWATTYNVQTLASIALTCSIGAATVTPPAAKKKNANNLSLDPHVSVSVMGSCTTTTLRLVYAPKPGVSRTVTLTGSGVRAGDVDGKNDNWTVGQHEIVLYDQTDAVRARMSLVVCDKTAATCG